MITINLYTFAKKENSTAIPTGTGAAFNCKVKSPSSLETPRVEISGAYPGGYNYAYIAAWNRYYFITDCEYDSGLWILSLHVDVLATYKTEIGNSNLYILRAASANNGNITDNYYPPTANAVRYRDLQDLNAVPGPFNTGVYVVNITGTNTAGNSTLVEFDPVNFQGLIRALYLGINGLQVTDFVDAVVQLFGGNPTKLINSCYWFPWGFVDRSTQNQEVIYIGSWSSNTPGYVISNPTSELDQTIFSIRKHPQAAARGNYLNAAPFSSYNLYIPGAGVIALDTTKMLGATQIIVTRTVDAFTGQMLVKVNTNTNQLLACITAQWGVPIIMGGNNPSNPVGAITGAIGAVSSALAGPPAALIGAASAGVGSLAGSMTGVSANAGTGSAINIIGEPITLDTSFYQVPGDDNTHNGRPLMDTRTINTLSGFIMVQRGDVPIDGTAEEQAGIRRYLEGGFYYE